LLFLARDRLLDNNSSNCVFYDAWSCTHRSS
jgi:hypothetical protein